MHSNFRPNQIAAKQGLIDKLQSDIAAISIQLADAQASIPVVVAVGPCDPVQIAEDLKWATQIAKDAKELYDETRSPENKARWRNKCKGDVLAELEAIQCTALHIANADVIDLQLQSFACMLQGAEDEVAARVLVVTDAIAAAPIDDRFCNRLIDKVLAGA